MNASIWKRRGSNTIKVFCGDRSQDLRVYGGDVLLFLESRHLDGFKYFFCLLQGRISVLIYDATFPFQTFWDFVA